MTPDPLIPAEQLEHNIHIIRGQRVMLDADLARLYGVSTKSMNQQLQRNKGRFPEDFAFQLSQTEWLNLRSQIVTSSLLSESQSQKEDNLRFQFGTSGYLLFGIPRKFSQRSKRIEILFPQALPQNRSGIPQSLEGDREAGDATGKHATDWI